MVYLFHFATYFELNAGLRTPWPQYGTTSLQLNTYLEILPSERGHHGCTERINYVSEALPMPICSRVELLIQTSSCSIARLLPEPSAQNGGCWTPLLSIAAQWSSRGVTSCFSSTAQV